MRITTKVFLYSIFFVILSYLTYFVFYNNYWFDSAFIPCLKFLQEGTLYGGQPLCEQGPMLFLLIYPLWLLSNVNIYYYVKFITFLFAIGLFVLTTMFVKRETGKEYFVLTSMLYLFLYFVFAVNEYFGYRFVDIIALFFMMLGFYIMLYTEIRYKSILSGILFAFALLMKFNLAIILLFVFIYLLIKYSNLDFKNKKFSFKLNMPEINNLIYMILTISVIYIYFLIKYPKFLHYSLITFVGPENTYMQAVYYTFLQFISFKPIYLVFSLIIIISVIFYFLRGMNVFSFISIFGILFIFIGQNRVSENLYHLRYISIIIPFFIISFIKYYNQLKFNKNLKHIMYLILLILILPGLILTYLSIKEKSLEYEVNSVIKYIPKQNLILTTQKLDLMYGVDLGDYDFLDGTGGYDGWTGPKLQNLGLVNLSEWDYSEWNKTINYFIPKILFKDYSALFMDPKFEDGNVDISILLGFIYNKFYENEQILKGGWNEENIKNFFLNTTSILEYRDMVENRYFKLDFLDFQCGFNLLNIKSFENRYLAKVLFTSAEDCENFGKEIDMFARQHFDSICKKDRAVGKAMINVYTVLKDEKCNSDGSILKDYSEFLSRMNFD